ncbi:Dihydroxy-acid dehydratase [Hibiscus syriacus]|uniref:Dihydroxy-acid dehydratase n=1 Tax=Hibiscus syriacus TaxID=106335 RepID=A0A6A3C4X0_HIBSY|nr:dihydroxy-acid dehydratase, chloroplastic-like [Hibiscus syriacus]XP_039060751.1 dihydroxy-acid dehydratase, chloroplastic-like [Hibiscus syriacus]XP_039060752.1 dihydroxy-acid dehydratase, chloroplastic-like [Hibiscus syriacus]KAE8723844.1 Dihydroxy-acid dehydratase [Hibiscus syriacus]
MQATCQSPQATAFPSRSSAAFLTRRASSFPTLKPFAAPPNHRHCFRNFQFPPSFPTIRLKKHSSSIADSMPQATVYGFGSPEADLRKPKVGIYSVSCAGNKCNAHLLKWSEEVNLGVKEREMVAFRSNTGEVSDATTMGNRGMCNGLQSRDFIADSIAARSRAGQYDGNISIPGCDENMSGAIIAMGRLNRPSILIYGGAIKPHHFHGNTNGIISDLQCSREYVSGEISDEQRASGGKYAPNTLASAMEALGMSLPYRSSISAEDPLKLVECRLAGKYLLELLKMDIKPQDIITHKSLRNAMVIVIALGESTNAVSHLIAIARSVGLELTSDDFLKVSDEVSFLADLKPGGIYDNMEDLHKIGGTPEVIRYLLELGCLDGDCMTVTGKTMAENAQSYPLLPDRPVGTVVLSHWERENVADSRGEGPNWGSQMLTLASVVMGAILSKETSVDYAVKLVLNSVTKFPIKLVAELVKVVMKLVRNALTRSVTKELLTESVIRFVAPLAAYLVKWFVADLVEWFVTKLMTKLVAEFAIKLVAELVKKVVTKFMRNALIRSVAIELLTESVIRFVAPLPAYLVKWFVADLVEWFVTYLVEWLMATS